MFKSNYALSNETPNVGLRLIRKRLLGLSHFQTLPMLDSELGSQLDSVLFAESWCRNNLSFKRALNLLDEPRSGTVIRLRGFWRLDLLRSRSFRNLRYGQIFWNWIIYFSAKLNISPIKIEQLLKKLKVVVWFNFWNLFRRCWFFRQLWCWKKDNGYLQTATTIF